MKNKKNKTKYQNGETIENHLKIAKTTTWENGGSSMTTKKSRSAEDLSDIRMAAYTMAK